VRANLVIPHAYQSLDQDVAVQQHEAAHELSGAGPALLPQPLTATHQLLMRHLHPGTHSFIHSFTHSFIHSFVRSFIHSFNCSFNLSSIDFIRESCFSS